MVSMDVHSYLNAPLVLLQQQQEAGECLGCLLGCAPCSNLQKVLKRRSLGGVQSQPQLFCLTTWEGAEAEPSSRKG